jgi:hypothetical protein
MIQNKCFNFKNYVYKNKRKDLKDGVNQQLFSKNKAK